MRMSKQSWWCEALLLWHYLNLSRPQIRFIGRLGDTLKVLSAVNILQIDILFGAFQSSSRFMSVSASTRGSK